MWISDEEYALLKNQVRDLQQRVNILNVQKDFASVVKQLPYSSIGSIENGTPIFKANQMPGEAWRALTCLGRYIHEETRLFYMSTAGPADPSRPYIRSANGTKFPRKISDMKPEQIELSVMMLDEMIEVYNKYYELANPYVHYAESITGEIDKVPVRYPERE